MFFYKELIFTVLTYFNLHTSKMNILEGWCGAVVSMSDSYGKL